MCVCVCVETKCGKEIMYFEIKKKNENFDVLSTLDTLCEGYKAKIQILSM